MDLYSTNSISHDRKPPSYILTTRQQSRSRTTLNLTCELITLRAQHFLRDHVEKGNIDLIYIPTERNLADLLTKGLPRPRHEDLTEGIGVMRGQGGVL